MSLTHTPTGPPNVVGEPSPLQRQVVERPRRTSSLGRDTHRWSRNIHVYTSMIALIVVLFFAVTGLTLNHPDWTFGDETETTTESGTFPFPTRLVGDDATATGVDFLSISEFVRDEFGVVGSVDSFNETSGEGSISYTNPGYRADLFFDIDAGTFELSVEQEGWVAVVNDLHKGRNTGSSWSWLIDISAVFLIVISVTGLVMQFFLKKRRRSALVTAGVGAAATLLLIGLAVT